MRLLDPAYLFCLSVTLCQLTNLRGFDLFRLYVEDSRLGGGSGFFLARAAQPLARPDSIQQRHLAGTGTG